MFATQKKKQRPKALGITFLPYRHLFHFSIPIIRTRTRPMAITLTIAHSLRRILRLSNQTVLAVARVPAARAQPHRAHLIVHIAIAEIPMALARMRLHPVCSAEAIVAREQIHAHTVRAQ